MTISTRPDIETHAIPFEAADRSFKERWNTFVAEAEHGHLQQGYEHTELKSEDGWSAAFVWTESNDEITSGTTLLWRRLWKAPYAVAMAPRGPLWRDGSMSSVGTLLEKVADYCRKSHVVFCRINPACSMEEYSTLETHLPKYSRELSHIWSYWNLPRPVMILDLEGTIDQIMGRMAADVRANCRKAERQGVSVLSNTESAVCELSRVMCKMGDRKSVHVRTPEHFQRLFDTYTQNRAAIMVAEYDGETIGASFVVSHGTTAWSLYSAFDYAFRKRKPNEALQLAMIRWAKERGCKALDLGGTCTHWPPDPSDKGYGVYLFKKRLGAQTTLTAPYCDLVYRPVAYQLARIAENIGLPLKLERGTGKLKVITDRIRNGM